MVIVPLLNPGLPHPKKANDTSHAITAYLYTLFAFKNPEVRLQGGNLDLAINEIKHEYFYITNIINIVQAGQFILRELLYYT